MIHEEAAEVAITNNVESSSKSRSGETDDIVNGGRASKASTGVPVAATEKTIKVIKRPSTNTRVNTTTADQLSAQGGAKRESVLAAVPEKPITDE